MYDPGWKWCLSWILNKRVAKKQKLKLFHYWMEIEQMRGHKAEPVFHSKMGRLRKARKFCCDGNPLAKNYRETDRQTTGISLINDFLIIGCTILCSPYRVFHEDYSLCHLMATNRTAKVSFITGPYMKTLNVGADLALDGSEWVVKPLISRFSAAMRYTSLTFGRRPKINASCNSDENSWVTFCWLYIYEKSRTTFPRPPNLRKF